MSSKKHSLSNSEIIKIYEERFNPDEEFLGREKKVNKIEPLVSVFITTYQHAPFIRDCLEGVLMQKTTFPVEILIGEDESTDGTREICMEYAEKHPDKIRLFLRDRKTSQLYDEDGNLIMRFNHKWLRKSARGKYIAVCEGDDYWTDENKLQKQFDFLNKHDDYVLTVGGYLMCNDKSGKMKKVIRRVNKPDNEQPGGYTFTGEMASKRWITKTLTIMYRNLEELFNELYIYRNSRDVHFIYHLMKYGKGFYFTEVFGVYRIHDGGVYSSKSAEERVILRYNISKELYLKNKDNNSRLMYLIAISVLLRNCNDEFYLRHKKFSKFRLPLEYFQLLRTPGEFFTFARTVIGLLLGSKN